ncbi:hypothetical protein [Hamadaea tsunoensis]|uniref:hypothetical protein n=1 Tax=Hamadaea tsunoensis TaxID=53368 RepID=UPI0004153402|nr:hypothetical protein [Hamadaea tsunoensis]
MGQAIIHRPRLAWDAAQAFVTSVEHGRYRWLRDRVALYLGDEYADRVTDTEVRLRMNPEAANAEMGLWRVVLDELIFTDPRVVPVLTEIVQAART